MDFEKAYERYKAGNASDEETAFVEGEIAKAKKLSSIIDDIDARQPIAPSDAADVKRAKTIYTLRNSLRMALIATLCVILIAGIACACIFGVAISSAKNSTHYTLEQAKDIAVTFVTDNYTVSDGAVVVKEANKALHFEAKLSHSTYRYYVEVQNGARMEVDLIIDSKTGAVTLEEIDND